MKNLTLPAIFIGWILIILPASAQMMQGHEMSMESMVMPGMNSMMSPDLPMQRDGSGTSWITENFPMRAIHTKIGSFPLMIHGSVSLRYTNQNVNNSDKRGGDKFDGPNWIMVMAEHSLGRGRQISARGMISLDRITEGGGGYPLLFQTGETWKGKRLIDSQHPHDLFSELSATFAQSLSRDFGLFGYLGMPGEPALGPPAFMHRPSCEQLLDAPLAHHWQDATHIEFGVASIGIRYKTIKIDGSIFTGREPDENRYNFDKPKFDSQSGRLSINPSASMAFQISYAFIKEPEALEPGRNQHRATASLMYNHKWADDNNWASTFVWGMNKPDDLIEQHSLLLETDLRLKPLSIFGRAEFIQKNGEELGIEGKAKRIFPIGALTAGIAKPFWSSRYFELSLGAQGTVYDQRLTSYYGDSPISFEIYLHLLPLLMHMDHEAQSMPGMKM